MTEKVTDQTIFRRERNAENPYFMMARDVAQNRALSYEALGLLAYLLSRPDDWQIQLRDLYRDGCGRDKTKRLIMELQTAGHMHLAAEKQEHDDLGMFAPRAWIVTEKPFTEKPVTVPGVDGLTAAGEPLAANPPLHSNDLQSQESKSKEFKKVEKEKRTEEESSAPKPEPEPIVQILDELQKPTQEQVGQVMRQIHENIQVLSQMVKDDVVDLLNDYGFDDMQTAIQRAVDNNKRSMSYIKRTLEGIRKDRELQSYVIT